MNPLFSVSTKNRIGATVIGMILMTGCGLRRLIPDPVPIIKEPGTVRVVEAEKLDVQKIADGSPVLLELLDKANQSIDVPYKWGGTSLSDGIDCSNFTWQLYQSVGLPYHRFYSTRALAHLPSNNRNLFRIPFEEASTGDLLVYGRKDSKGKWHGHVVILIDKDGSLSGVRGLVLGSHGGNIGGVQYITYPGFDAGYFISPRMKLCSVVRVEGVNSL